MSRRAIRVSVPIGLAALVLSAVPAVGGGDPDLLRYRMADGALRAVTPAGLAEPAPFAGVLGLPPGPGRAPVVVVLHGSHPVCTWPAPEDQRVSPEAVLGVFAPLCSPTRIPVGSADLGPDHLHNEAGLAWLVGDLARAGYVAVAPNVNGAYLGFNGRSGEVNERIFLNRMVRAHLRVLENLDRGVDYGTGLAPRTTGRIDTSRIAYVGHSRGGGHAYLQATAAARHPRAFALVLLQPVSEPRPVARSIPTLLVRGGCDEDAGRAAGLAEGARLARRPGARAVVDLLIPRAGHAMLNSGLTGSGVLDPVCPALADRTTVQRQIGAAAVAFLDRARTAPRARRVRIPVVPGAATRLRSLVPGHAVIRVGSVATPRVRALDLPVVTSPLNPLAPPPAPGLLKPPGFTPEL